MSDYSTGCSGARQADAEADTHSSHQKCWELLFLRKQRETCRFCWSPLLPGLTRAPGTAHTPLPGDTCASITRCPSVPIPYPSYPALLTICSRSCKLSYRCTSLYD